MQGLDQASNALYRILGRVCVGREDVAFERAGYQVNICIVEGQKFGVQFRLAALDTRDQLAKICQRIRQVAIAPEKSRHICSADGFSIAREQIGNNQKRLLGELYLMFAVIQKSDFTKSSE
ncbi:hypothetical protein FHT85_000522 [Rhizobium sp. BK312]|uniref:hypothetical protein n=1 Tax=Rhizobium sp. BK312 TaxID=2587080 RepID=UPI00182ABBE2|nr:hypothetical protein [Rhizobium sp. BK312]MBB3423563.1 hypothetical protein [Rhizobium sp. BK312]